VINICRWIIGILTLRTHTLVYCNYSPCAAKELNNVLSACILGAQFLRMLLCSVDTDDLGVVRFIKQLCFDDFYFLFCELFGNKDFVYFNSLFTTSANAVLEFLPASPDPSYISLPPPLWPPPAQWDVCDMYDDYTIIILFMMAVFSLNFPGSVPIRMFACTLTLIIIHVIL
jgi:hypothetical protein